MARLLLDTHVLLWSLAEPARMTDRARDAIDQLARQNRALALARDLLLPPLMSGELEPMTSDPATELARLVAGGEGVGVEFKRSLTKDVGRGLCAFANAGGGTVLLGVSDAGKIVGVADHNRLKARVLSTARSADPPIGVEAESLGDVLRVVVPPQKRKPYSFGGRFFMRDGASSRPLSNAEVEELFYAAGRLHFDRKPCPDFSIDNNLDDETWARFSRRAKIPESMDRMVALRSLGLLDNDDRMTHAGAWLLARDIRRFTTSAHVSCALFMGTEKVRILDRRDFHGDVPAMVDDAVAWILTKINVELVIRRVRREQRPELPEEALREAVANAVAHRDYRSTANVQIYVFKDRIEIVSPGGLPAGVSEADLGVKSMPRNPLLFGMLYRMDVVENIGSGIRRIRDLCREHGVAEPVIDASEHWVTVTFRRPAGLDDEPDSRKTGGEAGRGPESQPEPGPESRRDGPESAGDGLESAGDGLESAGDGLESTGEGLKSAGEGLESLERRALALLATEPLSRSALAEGLGHRSVSAGLNRVIHRLLKGGRAEYTVPDKPNSRRSAAAGRLPPAHRGLSRAPRLVVLVRRLLAGHDGGVAEAEKLRVDQWREKDVTQSAVEVAIHDFLYSDETGLPASAYSEDDVTATSEAVFAHVYRAYPTVPSPYYYDGVAAA